MNTNNSLLNKHLLFVVERFYIGCDKCNDWFHGSCVGITQAEAEVVEEYICPRCNSSNIQNVVASQKTLTPKDYDQLRRVVRQLEVR